MGAKAKSVEEIYHISLWIPLVNPNSEKASMCICCATAKRAEKGTNAHYNLRLQCFWSSPLCTSQKFGVHRNGSVWVTVWMSIEELFHRDVIKKPSKYYIVWKSCLRAFFLAYDQFANCFSVRFTKNLLQELTNSLRLAKWPLGQNKKNHTLHKRFSDHTTWPKCFPKAKSSPALDEIFSNARKRKVLWFHVQLSSLAIIIYIQCWTFRYPCVWYSSIIVKRPNFRAFCKDSVFIDSELLSEWKYTCIELRDVLYIFTQHVYSIVMKWKLRPIAHFVYTKTYFPIFFSLSSMALKFCCMLSRFSWNLFWVSLKRVWLVERLSESCCCTLSSCDRDLLNWRAAMYVQILIYKSSSSICVHLPWSWSPCSASNLSTIFGSASLIPSLFWTRS